MSKRGKLTVADFFCGAGGFSEGFRQAGFEVAFALDNWAPAIATHELNHPGCKHALMNILELDTPDKINEVVTDTDVIIGSPPCVSFSGSNKAGKADKSLGIQLIEAQLRIIAVKKHKPGSKLKYWLMENVPNSANYVKDKYTFEELGLPGGKKIALEIPVRNIFNAANYGAPQTRKRFVCGDYPEPRTTHAERDWVSLHDVTTKLGRPWAKPKIVEDPCYGFNIPSDKLTDHRYDTTVEEFEWRRALRLKRDHGYMGKMSFPEDTKRPSRTVMATRSASTREAMILEGKDGNYRLPTIREVATFMSFPIIYQFQGGNESVKYRLVGNAVCCKMSNALAKAIMLVQNLKIPGGFVALPDVKPDFDLTGHHYVPKKPHLRLPDARFERHVPELKSHSFRVVLTNKESNFNRDKIIWTCHLHHGSGKNAKNCVCNSSWMMPVLANHVPFGAFEKDVKTIVKSLPSASAWHEAYRQIVSPNRSGPDDTIEKVKDIIDEHFPIDEYENVEVKVPMVLKKLGRESVPIRIAAGAFAISTLTEYLRLRP